MLSSQIPAKKGNKLDAASMEQQEVGGQLLPSGNAAQQLKQMHASGHQRIHNFASFSIFL